MPISIPVDAHIITLKISGSPVASKWKSSDVKQVFDIAKAYWLKTANIEFLLNSTNAEAPIELPGDTSSSLIDDNSYFFLISKYPSKNGAVTMLLVGEFSKMSNVGGSTEDSKACALSANTNLKQRSDALAHELGHLLSLDHIDKPGDKGMDLVKLHSNLMYSGIHGDKLTASQIKQARNSKLSKAFGGP